MARPIKQGIDYFSIDCDPDDNFKFIEAQHGLIGFGVVAKLWLRIYSINGYWCEWTKKSEVIFAKEIGVPVSDIQAIVKTCFEENIFHKGMYEKYDILTSSGCQKYWKHVVTNAKRKFTDIDPKYNLLKTPEKTELTPEEIKLTPEDKNGKKVFSENRGKHLKNELTPEETEFTPEETQLTHGESTRSRNRNRNRSNTVTNTPKENTSCCYAEIEDLKTAAAAAIRIFDSSLPDEVVMLLAKELATKFVGKQIADLQALANGFVKNRKPPVKNLMKSSKPIELDGVEHKPVMNGKGYVYPTILGVEFSEDFKKVKLMDGTWQTLESLEHNAAKQGNLKPKSIYKKAN